MSHFNKYKFSFSKTEIYDIICYHLLLKQKSATLWTEMSDICSGIFRNWTKGGHTRMPECGSWAIFV